MTKFIELRFGQGDLGRRISKRKDVEEGETFIQREMVPIKAIKDAYVILPERRNIKIKFEVDGHIYSRIEYYKNEIDCIKRWSMIKHYLGARTKLDTLNPVPLPMDAEKWKKMQEEQKDE